MPEPVVLTRRRGLALAALAVPTVLLAACSSDDGAAPVPTGAGSASPGAVDATTRQESALIASYDAVLAAFPDLTTESAAILASIRDQHAQHRDALGGAPDAEVAAAVTPAAGLDATLRGLIAAERDASRVCVRACVEAADADVARTLAFIGASEASHVPALRDLRP
jgi:hypothetical protein